MAIPFLAVATSVATPVLLLVVGLAVLAVGLALLTGGGRARRRPAPTYARPAAPATPAPPADAPCDWSAWLEGEAGERVLLRGAAGRACCRYVIRVRDLDPVAAPLDQVQESLVWAGEATRLSRDGARTPLTRDLVTRRAATGAGTATLAMGLDRTAGPTVATAADLPHVDADDPEVERGTARRAARLWHQHLDDLHAHGARPAPSDGDRVAPAAVQRRVELVVAVDRGCEVAAHRCEAEVACEARLDGSVAVGTARLAAPLLASWVEVGTATIAADAAVDGQVGIAAWHPTSVPPAHGVTATGGAASGSCAAAWQGRRTVRVDERRATVVVGSAVRLELEADDDQPEVRGELHASTAADVRVHLGTADGRGAGCARCLPEVEVRVGRTTAPDVRSTPAGSTCEVTIGLDGHTVRLQAPTPDGGARSWTVDPADVVPGAPQPATL